MDNTFKLCLIDKLTQTLNKFNKLNNDLWKFVLGDN